MESRIVAHDVKIDRRDQRVLEKQINNWVHDHTQEDADCEMIFESTGPHQFICRTLVKSGAHEWVGQDSGKSPQDAASKTLKHLHEKKFIADNTN